MEQQSFSFTRPYLPRPERLELTFSIVAKSRVPLSLLEICRRQGVRKTGHMRGIVEELVEEGSLAYGPERVNACGENTVTYTDPYRPF